MTKPLQGKMPVRGWRVSLAEARHVADELPTGRYTKDEATRELHLWLNEKGEMIRLTVRLVHYDPVRKANLREGLQRIPRKASLSEYAAALGEADKDVLHQLQFLYDEATAHEQEQGETGKNSITKILSRIANAVDMALELTAGTPGQQHFAGAYAGARVLKDKFEEMSGCRFTFDRHRVGGHIRWLTPGARFTAAGLQAWFPNIVDSQIESAMKNLSGNTNLPHCPGK